MFPSSVIIAIILLIAPPKSKAAIKAMAQQRKVEFLVDFNGKFCYFKASFYPANQ